jgi:hypothetical protein
VHIVELLQLSQETWDHAISIQWPGDASPSKITIEEVIKMHVDHLAGHLEDMANTLKNKA